MDGDTIDDSGAGDLALHGVTKIEDLQAAIINKDVMLSGISSQSPVASAHSLSAVTMPTCTLPSLSAALSSTLGDNIFLGLQSLGMSNLMSELARPGDNSNGILSQVFSSAGQSQSQSATAPQLFLAAAAAAANNQSAASALSSTLPVQHFLIPVSTNGVQQLISVPLSLTATGAGHTAGQMQLLATPGGQFITTNVGQSPVNIAMPTTSSSMQSLFMVMPPVNTLGSLIMSPNAAALAQNAAHSLALQQLTQHQNSASSALGLSQMPQILANAQGQIVAIGSPQMLQQALLAASSNNAAAAAAATVGAKLVACLPADGTSQQSNLLLSTPQLQLKQNLVNSIAASVAASRPVPSVLSSASAISHSTNGPLTTMTHITPNINQLLPNTISSSREGTVVDGVNLDEMREFAKQFKIRRLSLGLTQTQVGQALSVTEGPSYSQSAICRFEKLDITPKSAQKIKPVLERWMAMAEERYKNGAHTLSDFIGLEPSKKRKRRTSFTPQALEILNDYFDRNTHPSGTEMTDLADKLNFDREVIRVWFCNKRQTLKNSVKKLKGPSPPIT